MCHSCEHRTTVTRIVREQAQQAWDSGVAFCACLVDPTEDGPVVASVTVSVLYALTGVGRSEADRLDALAGPFTPASASARTTAQLRAAVRGASAAAGRVGALSGQVSDAQGRLDAAKRMAADARSLRDTAGDRAAERLHDASAAGIEPNSWWEDFKGAGAKAWDVLVTVATVVAIVVAVIALFVGGPLVWGILLAASAVLLADSIDKYARGEGSIWMIGLNLLGVIPGGRLLTGLGRIVGLSRVGTRAMAAGGRGLAAARSSLGNAATGLRNGLGNRIAILGSEAGVLRFPFAGRAARNSDEVRSVLDELPRGRSSNARIRTVGDDAELRQLFNGLTGRPVPATGTSGRSSVILADGTRIQWRANSASGGATIDVFPPHGPPRKVHIDADAQ